MQWMQKQSWSRLNMIEIGELANLYKGDLADVNGYGDLSNQNMRPVDGYSGYKATLPDSFNEHSLLATVQEYGG